MLHFVQLTSLTYAARASSSCLKVKYFWNTAYSSCDTQSASYSENISLFFNISYFVEVYNVAVGPFALQQLALIGADFMKAVIFKASD